MKRIFGAVLFALLSWSAQAQYLTLEDLDASMIKLYKTYTNDCRMLTARNLVAMTCAFKIDPSKPDDHVRVMAQRLDTGNDPRERRQISVSITPGLMASDAALAKYLELAKEIALPNGGTLADKFPTPQSAVEYCKSRPESEKTVQKCAFNELENSRNKIGISITSQPDLFFVSVLEERK